MPITLKITYQHKPQDNFPFKATAMMPDGSILCGASYVTFQEARERCLAKIHEALYPALEVPCDETLELPAPDERISFDNPPAVG